MMTESGLTITSSLLESARSAQKDLTLTWALVLMTLKELTVSQSLRRPILTWVDHLLDLLLSPKEVMSTSLQANMTTVNGLIPTSSHSESAKSVKREL